MQTEGLNDNQRKQLAAMACGGIAYISNLAVTVNMRRKGIGLELLHAAEQAMPFRFLTGVMGAMCSPGGDSKAPVQTVGFLPPGPCRLVRLAVETPGPSFHITLGAGH